MEPVFLIKESIVAGWHTLRANSALVFKVTLSIFALEMAVQVIDKIFKGTVLGVVASGMLSLSIVVLGFGATIVTLKLVRKEPANYSNMLPSWKLTGRYLLSALFVSVVSFAPVVIAAMLIAVGAVTLGLSFTTGTITATWVSLPVVYTAVAVLVAGALTTTGYLLVRYSMARFAIVDGASAWGSLGVSARMSQGVLLRLASFFSALIILNLAGFALFFVGLVLTVPVSMLALGHVYQSLKDRVESEA